MKITTIPIVLLLAFLGCSSPTSVGSGTGSADLNTTSGYAPNGLIGRYLTFVSLHDVYTTETISDFDNSGYCTIPASSTFSVVGSPTYSYSRRTGTSASFELSFQRQWYMNSKNYFNSWMTYSLTLSYSSSGGGTYFGTLQDRTTTVTNGVSSTKTTNDSVNSSFSMN